VSRLARPKRSPWLSHLSRTALKRGDFMPGGVNGP
jgi:hypothetical protein